MSRVIKSVGRRFRDSLISGWPASALLAMLDRRRRTWLGCGTHGPIVIMEPDGRSSLIDNSGRSR